MPGPERLTRTLAGLAVTCALAAPALAEPRMLGLVVGISDYAAFGPWDENQAGQPAYDLLGAANDARLIADAMRRAGIALPDNRLLLDSSATKPGFLEAWRSLLAEAQPGDTLVVSFAGHGAQERERSEPLDEDDQRDEILMFHDFDPAQAGIGRLTDDELQVLFTEARDYRVIWVADSCHSGGLTRKAGRTLSRFGGLFDGLDDPSLSDVPLVTDGAAAEGADQPYLTQILATASEDRLVEEVEIEGRMHGALSWYFAQALDGGADADGDGRTTRAELRNYLDTRVYTLMNQTQQPRILPRADSEVLLVTAAEPALPEPVVQERPPVDPSASGHQDLNGAMPDPPPSGLPVTILGAHPPGLEGEDIREVELGAALRFEEEGPGLWAVYNQTGDRVTRIDTTGRLEAALQGLPDSAAPLLQRTRVLQDLKELAAFGEDAPRIRLESGDSTIFLGDQARFAYSGPSASLPYLTLFNLASNGNLQLVYPIVGDGAQTRDDFSIDFEVTKPTGVDQLFALACPTPPNEIRAFLRAGDQQTVTPEIAVLVRNSACRMSVTGLYTDDTP